MIRKIYADHSKSKVKSLSHVRLFVTPWTIAYQAPPSIYWSGLPFPSPGDLPDPGIEPRSPTFQADALTSEPPGKPIHTHIYIWLHRTSPTRAQTLVLGSGAQS